MSQFCMMCGQLLDPSDIFCGNCGKRVEDAPSVVPPAASEDYSFCMQCGMRLQADCAVCPSCGFSVSDEADEAFTEVWGVGDNDDPDASSDEFDDCDSPTTVVPQWRYVLTRVGDGMRFTIDLPCVVGRGSAAGCKVSGNQTISRKHAEFLEDGGSVVIHDLSSTNSTFVNGAALPVDGRATVSDGDALRLGTEDFSFNVERS